MGQGLDIVGRIDPATDPDTGEIVEFPMPEPEAKDPHTGEFDASGRFSFTLQHSNRVGRLDPVIGAIELVELDRPRSRPYGIKIDENGNAPLPLVSTPASSGTCVRPAMVTC